MKSKFEIYCKLFKTKPNLMRKLLSNYFYYPSDIRNSIFDEYSARKTGQFINGRLPRPDADISMEFKLSKTGFEKLLEIHESGLFPNILEADEDWAKENKEIIARKLAYWENDLNAKRMSIPGARKIYEYAPEIHDKPAA